MGFDWIEEKTRTLQIANDFLFLFFCLGRKCGSCKAFDLIEIRETNDRFLTAPGGSTFFPSVVEEEEA